MTTESDRNADPLERAQALHDTGHHPEAEALLSKALAAGRGTPAAFRLLAAIERALHAPEREALALEQALGTTDAKAKAADVARLWLRLGAVREWLGDRAGALAAYERASEIDNGQLEAHRGIARNRLALQDIEGAERSAEDLERRFPESAFTHLFAGHVRKAHGDAAVAGECYRRALEREPDLGEALYNLVDLGLPGSDDELASRTSALAAREDLPAADRTNAHFAHARILDRAGRYAEAFEHFARANDIARDDLARRGIEYVPSRVEARVTRTIEEYPASGFIPAFASMPVDLVPIFIVGLPRSGTTLIEQILAAHGDVQTAGEVPFARECEQAFRQGRVAAGRSGAVDAAHPVDAALLDRAREQYIERLFERNLDARWIVDKLPANFEIAGFLRSMFPAAPIVHSVRDPRATCFSLYWSNFAAHEPWYHDLGHLAHYCRQYQRLMKHWRNVIPGPFVEPVYEELVRDPRVQIADLLREISLEFDHACTKFYEQERPILTASHAQVRRPMNTSSIDRWRHYTQWLGPIHDLWGD